MKPRARHITRTLAAAGLALALLGPAGAIADTQQAVTASARLKPAPTRELTPQEQELARQIKAEVMAPCCWNGTVDSHNSPAALKLGGEIDALVGDGLSRSEILNRISSAYGERILAKPRTEGLGLMFYVGPGVLSVAGLGLLWRWLRRNVAAGPVAGVSSATTASTGPEGTVATGPVPADSAASWDARFERQLKSVD